MEKDIQKRYNDEQVLFCYSRKSDTTPKADTFSPHSHDVCEFLLFKGGDVAYSTRGRRYILQPYDLIISRPSEIHRIEIISKCTYERYNILYDEKNLPFDFLGKLPGELDLINVADNRTLRELFEKMEYYCDSLDGSEQMLMMSNISEEIIVNILLELKNAKLEIDHTVANSIVGSAIEYIDKHLTTISDIDEICRELFITKSHLHHLFVKHMGIAPKKYITAKRLVLAERAIFSGAKPTEIYESCGFSDYSTFYRAYKNHFGRSPSEKTTEPISIEKNPI